MPRITTNVTPGPTIDISALTNAEAEIVDALIVDDPAPAHVEVEVPARPTCLFCGDDYEIRPEQPTGDDPATMLIDGCECDGCAALRALIVPDDDTTPAPPIDPTPHMAPVSLSWQANEYSTATLVEGVACPDCAARASVFRPHTCGYCGEWLAASAQDHHADDFAARLITFPGQVTALTVGQAPARRTRSRSWHFRRVVRTDELNASGDMESVCQSCYDNAAVCECGVMVPQGSDYYCDDCDSNTLCNACYTADHQHRETNTLETARMSFRARTSIEGALANAGVPGDTIVSTRALGIEVETARGDAMAVVSAEAQAPVPVLANVGSDGSVRGRGAVEYRLLPQRGLWAEYAIRMMGQWCSDAGYRPDFSAGIHMHVDCSGLIDAEVYQALAVLVSLDDVLFAHANNERRNSTYCVPFPAADRAIVVERALNYARNGSRFSYTVTGDSRYRSVNSHAYSGHGTLEVRVFDSCHTPEAAARFIDAAAIIAGAVDFARLDAFRDLLVAWPTLADADVTLVRMAEAGCITHACALRAIARLRESAPATVAA